MTLFLQPKKQELSWVLYDVTDADIKSQIKSNSMVIKQANSSERSLEVNVSWRQKQEVDMLDVWDTLERFTPQRLIQSSIYQGVHKHSSLLALTHPLSAQVMTKSMCILVFIKHLCVNNTCFLVIFVPRLMWCVCVSQDILNKVTGLQHIIVVDDTPTPWPGCPRDIRVHNMAAVMKLGARSENGMLSNTFLSSLCEFIGVNLSANSYLFTKSAEKDQRIIKTGL